MGEESVATKLTLAPVAPKDLGRIRGLPRARNHTAKFPSRLQKSARVAKSGLRRWQDAQPAPTAPKNPEVRIKAVKPTERQFAKLRAIARSTSTTEVLNQRMSQDSFLGTLYTALTTYEYMQLEAEYKSRKASNRSAATVEAEWAAIQKAAQGAFAAAGLKAVSPGQLSAFSKALRANTANRDAIIKIANTGVSVGASARLGSGFTATATFVPTVAKLVDRLPDLIIPIPDLCSRPFAEGSFTRHFGSSVSLSVRITYWCPTWTNPFRTCTKTVTVAGVSWSVGVSVGYRVSCCGATVWGQGTAQACATIVGVRLCASCTATITGVAGIARTPNGTNCNYGLGISVSLRCTLFGSTIFSASAPFGWTIAGPCPPAGLCR